MPARQASDMGLTLQITRLLEKGARAHVYVVEAAGHMSGTLALKWLQDTGWESSARFADEGALLCGLRHPMLPAGYRTLALEGRPAILMELGVGVTARELLDARGPMSAPAALELCAQLAECLDFLHHATMDGQQLKLVHRDLKPEDIMVRADGSVMLLDLGSAKANLKGRKALTAGLYKGDPRRAPGVAKNASGFDPSIDTFELGLLLLELILGDLERFPEGLSPDDLHSRVDSLEALPSDLRQLVNWMTASAGADRPRPGQVVSRLKAMAAAAPGERLVERAGRLVESVQKARVAQGQRASGLVGVTLVEQPDGSWRRRSPYLEREEITGEREQERIAPPRRIDEGRRGRGEAGETEFVRHHVAARPAAPTPAPPPRPMAPASIPATPQRPPPPGWGVAVAAVLAVVVTLGLIAIGVAIWLLT